MSLLPDRRLAAAALLTVAICSAGCRSKEADPAQVAVTVQAAHPTRGPVSEEIAADAILAPLSQAAIAPRVSAPIKAEYVQRGAHVRKGQLLVSLEDRDLQGNALDSKGAFSTAQATYSAVANATNPEDMAKAQADVRQALAASDVAQRTADERRQLLQQGAIAGRDADTAYAAAVQAEANYQTAVKHLQSVQKTTQFTNKEASQGQLLSARGRLQSAEAQVSYANLRSPIDGVVTERPLFPGETATAGTPVITVMDTTALLAKLHLAQASAQQLGLGHKAEVQVPGMTDPVEATVSFISPALDPGSTTVEVWLKLANPEGRFKVGTPVHATISGNTVSNALQVPPDAIVPSQDGGTSVMVVGADSTIHKRPVKVGIRTADAVQILSGISPSDTVVTGGGYGLDDGTRVTIGKPEAGDKD